MNRTYWTCALILVLAAFAATAGFYPRLPETIPTHWNFRGQVDHWGPRSAAWLMPSVMLGMVGIFWILPRLSPRPFELDRTQSAYLFIMVLVVGLMGYMHAMSLWAALSPRLDISRALVAGAMLVIALMGNVLGKIKRNFYLGVRTPWTLVNERVWADTHRLAAWWFVAAGLLGFVIVLGGLPIWLALIPLVPAAVWPVIFSYLLYRRLEREGKLPEDAVTAG